MNRNDILWKGILEDVFDDFLTFFVPDASQRFDFERGFEFLDKELEQLFPPADDADYNPKEIDKLVKVFTRDGQEEWILVHVEVQGYTDPLFARRMFTYFSRIFDKYDRPITAFAILTDDVPGFQPTVFERIFLGTTLTYSFNSYKVLSQSSDELRASENPFAAVVLVTQTALRKKQVSEETMLDLKIDLVKQLQRKQFSKAKIRGIMNFLKNYIRFKKTENQTKFENVFKELTIDKKTMGIEELLLDLAKKEGRQEGRQEGAQETKRELVQNMIHRTQFSDEQIADLADTDVRFVTEIRQQLARQRS